MIFVKIYDAIATLTSHVFCFLFGLAAQFEILFYIMLRKSSLGTKGLKDNQKKVKRFLSKYNPHGIKIIFIRRPDMGYLGACSHPRLRNIVMFSSDWAKRILRRSDKSDLARSTFQNAFLETLGHEETHWSKDYLRDRKNSPIIGDKDFITFLHWMDEVHADFGGAESLLNSDRERFVAALTYKRDELLTQKKNIKKEPALIDKDSETHPSWQKRIKYATFFDYNIDLAEEIAKDVNGAGFGMTKDLRKKGLQETIKAVQNFYGEIILSPPIKA